MHARFRRIRDRGEQSYLQNYELIPNHAIPARGKQKPDLNVTLIDAGRKTGIIVNKLNIIIFCLTLHLQPHRLGASKTPVRSRIL